MSQTLMFQIRGVSIASQCVAVPDVPNWGGCVNCGHPRSTQVLTHGASSLISVTLSHAMSSPSRSGSGSVSIMASVASGTGAVDR